jgi:hypothetical protein
MDMLEDMTPQGFPIWLVADGATTVQLVVGWDFSPKYFGPAGAVVVTLGPEPRGPFRIQRPYSLYVTREEAAMVAAKNTASFLDVSR